MAEPRSNYDEAVANRDSILRDTTEDIGKTIQRDAALLRAAELSNRIAYAQLNATLALVEELKSVAGFFAEIPFGSFGGPVVEVRR